jgi:D-xylose reductase
VVGLGLWKIPRSATAQAVYDAIAIGYRHFDCACDYGNEAEVGDGFRRAFADGLVTRDQLWVTTKLWNTYHSAEHVEPALRKSLSDLGLDHVDLFLMHFPLAQRFVPFETRYPPEWIFDPTAAHPTIEMANVPLHVTWAAMEGIVRNGLASNIGVCNFNTALLRDLIAGAQILPAVLQVELHPYCQQPKLVRFAQEQVSIRLHSPPRCHSVAHSGACTH